MNNENILESLMQIFIAQMDSALKISNIISEHSNEEEMSPDSMITGLVYRLMISMDDKEMKESMDIANDLLNGESDEEEEDEDEEEEEEFDEGFDESILVNKKPRIIKKNTCNCNICAKARACLINYETYEVSDDLANRFKNAIDKTCSIHKIDIK
tara:strand:- start:168 stop:635 length:468 start_codon:yes stop_codon:yes gene_type:complete